MTKRLVRSVRGTERAVTRAAIQHHLWPAGATLVAAVSGGADSLCLLGTLLAMGDRGVPGAPGEIVVAHLDHGLRGAVGAADGRFVASLAEELGVSCVVERIDVAALARRERRSLEEAARRARYAFLRRVALEVGAVRICTGHTQDDQAETVIMHFVRGSGLAGLAGMAPLAGDVARPLLALTRDQTEAYCAARGWVPRQDASNADRRFTRNRIRRELLPILETYNPGVRATLARNATLIAADEAYLEAEAATAWEDMARPTTEPDDAGIALDLHILRATPLALRLRLYRRAARLTSGEQSALEARHLTLLEDLLWADVDERTLMLSDPIRVTRDAVALRFATDQKPTERVVRLPEAALPEAPRRVLPVPGAVEMPELGWRVRAWRMEEPAGLERSTEPPPPELSPFARAGDEARVGHATMRVYLAPELSDQPLSVRAWHPGDRFRPLGMAAEKKVQDYFADAKVPRAVRHTLPLVFGADHLLWIAGLRIDDRAKLGPDAQGALILQCEPLK